MTTNFLLYCVQALWHRLKEKEDLDFDGLNVNMIYDKAQWHCLIHVTDPI